jgi:hypothetical protein
MKKNIKHEWYTISFTKDTFGSWTLKFTHIIQFQHLDIFPIQFGYKILFLLFLGKYLVF